MSRSPGLIPLFLIAGCATDPIAAPPPAPATPPLRLLAATAPALPEAAAKDEVAADRSWEGALREQVAVAEDPVEPALELAAWLATGERHAEALGVVDEALRRSPEEWSLLVMRAGLLRDLGRRDAALATLRAVAGEAAAEVVHPGLLMAWAELEWLQGDGRSAANILAQIAAHHGDHAWLTATGTAVRDLEARVAGGPALRRFPMRDLLGDLRGAEDPVARARAFRLLQEGSAEVRARAAAVAIIDAEPVLRARAVSTVDLPAAALGEVCRRALTDPSPAVRTAAAQRAADLGQDACAMLLQVLEAEQDPAVFLTIHGVLASQAAVPADVDLQGAADPAVRAATVAAWRRRWPK